MMGYLPIILGGGGAVALVALLLIHVSKRDDSDYDSKETESLNSGKQASLRSGGGDV